VKNDNTIRRLRLKSTAKVLLALISSIATPSSLPDRDQASILTREASVVLLCSMAASICFFFLSLFFCFPSKNIICMHITFEGIESHISICVDAVRSMVIFAKQTNHKQIIAVEELPAKPFL
jgi:hypothetical protein